MEELINLLSDKSYYSLSIKYVAKRTEFTRRELRSLDGIKVGNDWFNIFTYNKVAYIGLESRRIAYEKDKEAGTNWVEDAIKRGDYDC